MAELVHSIREVGLLQPIVVRPHRRRTATSWSWASGAGGPPRRPASTTIPAIVRETDDDDMLRDALLENLHRSQLNPLEEAAAYQQLLDDFGCTHDELAARIGRSRPQISNTLRLLKLSPAGAAPGRRRRALGRARPGPARRRGPRASRTGSPAGSSPRASRCAAWRRSSRSATRAPPSRARGPAQPARPRPGSPTSPTGSRDRLETRVKVDLGKRKGKITVEFASLDDLRADRRHHGPAATATTGRSEPLAADVSCRPDDVDACRQATCRQVDQR